MTYRQLTKSLVVVFLAVTIITSLTLVLSQSRSTRETPAKVVPTHLKPLITQMKRQPQRRPARAPSAIPRSMAPPTAPSPSRLLMAILSMGTAFLSLIFLAFWRRQRPATQL